MKIPLLISIFFLFTLSLLAQKKQSLSPRLSPLQKTEIQVGIVDVELAYSRPSMRGRKIFGELVKYGEIWRTGANKNTKLTFHNTAIFGETTVPAGAYSLFTLPQADDWKIILYTLLDDYGAPEVIDEKKIIAQINVPVNHLDRTVESLDISFENLTNNSALLSISWEQSQVSVPLRIPTNSIIQSSLHTANIDLASDFESAAWTYYEYEKNYEQAFDAIHKCIAQMEKEEPLEMWVKTGDMTNPNRPRRYLLQADILLVAEQKKEAIAAAQKALEIAKLINSESYIKRAKERLEKW